MDRNPMSKTSHEGGVMSQNKSDPRDKLRGRSNVKDSPELIEFYEKLESKSATAFWRRANDIEPWEPITRYNPTLWRYQDLREFP